MPARKKKLTLSDSWRDKISVGVIVQRLDAHIKGTVKMSPTQINAARILLGKTIPDLARTEHTGLDGGAMQVANVDLRGLNDKDLLQMHALLSKATKE